jgi:TPR repeat protein
MHQLGMAYWRGAGVAADPALAENWLRRAVAADHLEAALTLGQLLLARTDDDGIEAAHWLRHAAEQGSTAGASALAQLYLTGHGVPKDREEATRWLDVAGSEADADALASMATNLAQDGEGEAATEWLRRAAANGSAAACYNLGVLYRSGRGVPRDTKQAIDWHAKAADRGHAPAAFTLGAIYAAGDEVGQDFVASVYRFRQAADAGHVVARCRLALMTAQGKGVPPAPAEGIGLLENMVAERIPEAAETLFELHWGGDGVPEDQPAAIGWLERAGELGSPTAPRILAEIYDRGEAVPRDIDRIFALLEQASSAGSLEAQTDIGRLLLLEGRYGVPDPAEAHRWLERAADAGHAEAQSLMGDFCREGLLGLPDPVAAETWYRRAIANGNSDALLTLAMMLEEAPPDRTDSHAEAFALLVIGARSGNAVAQAELAERYRQGIGCSPDEEAAARWLSAAKGRKTPARRTASLKRASNR